MFLADPDHAITLILSTACDRVSPFAHISKYVINYCVDLVFAYLVMYLPDVSIYISLFCSNGFLKETTW